MFEPFTTSLTVFAFLVMGLTRVFITMPEAQAAIDTGKGGRVVTAQALLPEASSPSHAECLEAMPPSFEEVPEMEEDFMISCLAPAGKEKEAYAKAGRKDLLPVYKGCNAAADAQKIPLADRYDFTRACIVGTIR